MVQIAASLLALLAAVSLTVAAPNALEARAPDCNGGGYLTNPQDAARCINELAALNSVCKTDYAGRVLRICGKAEIWSHSRTSKGASTPCKNVAASAGLIMDACTQNHGVGDMVGGSAYVQGNGDFWISIRGSYMNPVCPYEEGDFYERIQAKCAVWSKADGTGNCQIGWFSETTDGCRTILKGNLNTAWGLINEQCRASDLGGKSTDTSDLTLNYVQTTQDKNGLTREVMSREDWEVRIAESPQPKKTNTTKLNL